MKPSKIEDYPPHVQDQIRRKLAVAADAATANVQCSTGNVQCSRVQIPVDKSLLKIEYSGGSAASKRRVPNKTEQRFRDIYLEHIHADYEAVTFRLPGGSRYTPDWVWFDGAQLHAAEVKGSYRLHSHGRALTAFRECAAHFKTVVFHWAVWNGSQWDVKSLNDSTPTIPA